MTGRKSELAHMKSIHSLHCSVKDIKYVKKIININMFTLWMGVKISDCRRSAFSLALSYLTYH